MATEKHLTIDLSGFGGEYEDECQRIMWRAVRFARQEGLSFDDIFTPPERKDHAKPAPTYRDNPNYKRLEDAAVNYKVGPSGAMVGVAIGGAAVILNHGEEAAMKLDAAEGRVYEWEGELDDYE